MKIGRRKIGQARVNDEFEREMSELEYLEQNPEMPDNLKKMEPRERQQQLLSETAFTLSANDFEARRLASSGALSLGREQRGQILSVSHDFWREKEWEDVQRGKGKERR